MFWLLLFNINCNINVTQNVFLSFRFCIPLGHTDEIPVVIGPSTLDFQLTIIYRFDFLGVRDVTNRVPSMN